MTVYSIAVMVNFSFENSLQFWFVLIKNTVFGFRSFLITTLKGG